MAIGPIPDLRPLTAIQPDTSVPELRAVVRIENSSRSGNATSGRRQSPARQDDSAGESAAADTAEVAAAEPETPVGTKINFFA